MYCSFKKMYALVLVDQFVCRACLQPRDKNTRQIREAVIYVSYLIQSLKMWIKRQFWFNGLGVSLLLISAT